MYELLRDLPASGSKGSKLPIDLKAISSLPVLALVVADRRFSVDTYAAPSEIVVALYQENQKVERSPVRYWSRQLNPAERNYSATEKECLTLVWAVRKLRTYLLAREFDACTDHETLKWLQSIIDPSGRLMRWPLTLADFTYKIKYKKGRANVIANMLSILEREGHGTAHIDMELPNFSRLAEEAELA